MSACAYFVSFVISCRAPGRCARAASARGRLARSFVFHILLIAHVFSLHAAPFIAYALRLYKMQFTISRAPSCHVDSGQWGAASGLGQAGGAQARDAGAARGARTPHGPPHPHSTQHDSTQHSDTAHCAPLFVD